MLALPPRRALPRLLRQATASQPAITLPSFLVPAFQTAAQAQQPPNGTRPFSATAVQCSKLGRTPISIPPGVDVVVGEPKVKKDATTYLKVSRRTLNVNGPLGSLSMELEPFVNFQFDPESRMASLSVENAEIKQQKEMWGTTWSYLNRYVRGVSEGHTTVLRLVGIGYRASVESRPEEEQYPGQQFVVLKLGFSHPVVMPVPEGIKASAPQVTRILLEGIDKEMMHQFAAEIRRWRVPEPYKGKGIFVNDETIKLKQKKIK